MYLATVEDLGGMPKQAALGSGVQRLAPGDEAGALGPGSEVGGLGEVRDLGALGGLAVAAQSRLPLLGVEAVVVYGRCEVVV